MKNLKSESLPADEFWPRFKFITDNATEYGRIHLKMLRQTNVESSCVIAKNSKKRAREYLNTFALQN